MSRTDTDASPSGSDPRRRDRSSRRRRALRTLAVAVAVGLTIGAAALGSVGAAPTADGAAAAGGDSGDGNGESGPAIVVADATVESGSNASHRVSLTEAPDGLAGFELTLAVGDGGVATVANASYPDHFGLTSDPAVRADRKTVTVEAADLDDEIAPGSTDVTLATIDVTGVSAGETDLRVTDLQVDDDGGDAVEPSLEAGTLTVGDSSEATSETGDGSGIGSGTASDGNGSEAGDGSGSNGNDSSGDDTGSGNGSDSDDAESVPGFAIDPALAAIAVLVVAVLTQLR